MHNIRQFNDNYFLIVAVTGGVFLSVIVFGKFDCFVNVFVVEICD